MTASSYDFVIVGGGSAGCALANRLSEDPANRVLVLEAGRNDSLWDVFIHMPAALAFPIGSRFYDWKYESEPEPHMGGRRVYHARGKVLGGSSSVNGMIFQRGNPMDFERWASDRGMETCDHAHCLPYFKRMENCLAAAADDPYRGHDGPLVLERGPAMGPLFDAFVAAVQEAGLAQPARRRWTGSGCSRSAPARAPSCAAEAGGARGRGSGWRVARRRERRASRAARIGLAGREAPPVNAASPANLPARAALTASYAVNAATRCEKARRAALTRGNSRQLTELRDLPAFTAKQAVNAGRAPDRAGDPRRPASRDPPHRSGATPLRRKQLSTPYSANAHLRLDRRLGIPVPFRTSFGIQFEGQSPTSIERRGVEQFPEVERSARPRDIFMMGIGGGRRRGPAFGPDRVLDADAVAIRPLPLRSTGGDLLDPMDEVDVRPGW